MCPSFIRTVGPKTATKIEERLNIIRKRPGSIATIERGLLKGRLFIGLLSASPSHALTLASQLKELKIEGGYLKKIVPIFKETDQGETIGLLSKMLKSAKKEDINADYFKKYFLPKVLNAKDIVAECERFLRPGVLLSLWSEIVFVSTLSTSKAFEKSTNIGSIDIDGIINETIEKKLDNTEKMEILTSLARQAGISDWKIDHFLAPKAAEIDKFLEPGVLSLISSCITKVLYTMGHGSFYSDSLIRQLFEGEDKKAQCEKFLKPGVIKAIFSFAWCADEVQGILGWYIRDALLPIVYESQDMIKTVNSLKSSIKTVLNSDEVEAAQDHDDTWGMEPEIDDSWAIRDKVFLRCLKKEIANKYKKE